jgi:hypothetical protein
MKRIIFDALLFLIILFLPWWVSLFFALAGLFIFKNFYEYLVYGVFIFVLYFSPGQSFIASPLYFSLILTLSFVIIQIIKNHIIFYKE